MTHKHKEAIAGAVPERFTLSGRVNNSFQMYWLHKAQIIT